MSEILHNLFGNGMGGVIAGIFLVVGVMDIALFHLVLAPMYDRLHNERAEEAKKPLRLAMYGAASFCILLGLAGFAVVGGLL